MNKNHMRDLNVLLKSRYTRLEEEKSDDFTMNSGAEPSGELSLRRLDWKSCEPVENMGSQK